MIDAGTIVAVVQRMDVVQYVCLLISILIWPHTEKNREMLFTPDDTDQSCHHSLVLLIQLKILSQSKPSHTLLHVQVTTKTLGRSKLSWTLPSLSLSIHRNWGCSGSQGDPMNLSVKPQLLTKIESIRETVFFYYLLLLLGTLSKPRDLGQNKDYIRHCPSNRNSTAVVVHKANTPPAANRRWPHECNWRCRTTMPSEIMPHGFRGYHRIINQNK